MFIHFSHQRTATLAPCHSQRNQNVSPDSFCAKFLSGFNLVSETTRLIVEYFLVEEFLNKCCVICMMWIMPGPANTLRTKTTANTKHPPVLSMFCEEKDKTRQDMVKTVGIDTRAVHSAAPGGVTWGSPELRGSCHNCTLRRSSQFYDRV